MAESDPENGQPWQSGCRTANFRDAAMNARVFPFLPPRSASFSPQRRRSLLAPNGPRMYGVPCTNSVRAFFDILDKRLQVKLHEMIRS
jgi:hypothetical protein